MIGVIFLFGVEHVEVRVDNNNVLFRTTQTNSMLAPIDALRLDKSGCIKEHPDLRDRKDWREESVKRFKDHIKRLDTEKKKMEYIIKDLNKHGYKEQYWQQSGRRPVKL